MNLAQTGAMRLRWLRDNWSDMLMLAMIPLMVGFLALFVFGLLTLSTAKVER